MQVLGRATTEVVAERLDGRRRHLVGRVVHAADVDRVLVRDAAERRIAALGAGDRQRRQHQRLAAALGAGRRLGGEFQREILNHLHVDRVVELDEIAAFLAAAGVARQQHAAVDVAGRLRLIAVAPAKMRKSY